MERNFETVMIEQCAPALAGLKPACLFRHETRDEDGLLSTLAHWNEQLGPRGVRITVLRVCPHTNRYLVYLYREKKLRQLLTQPEVQAFLRQQGYTLPDPSGAVCEPLLAQLSARLRCEGDFPHEIGVFLGYPLADVVGFIRHQGRNFTCCGCWKSYGDPAAAQKLFAQLKKCTAVYLRLFHSGTPIQRLTVAA